MRGGWATGASGGWVVGSGEGEAWCEMSGVIQGRMTVLQFRCAEPCKGLVRAVLGEFQWVEKLAAGLRANSLPVAEA